MKSITTLKGALKHAQELWGKTACVEDKKKPTMLNGHVLSERFCVGRVLMGMFFSVEGDGATWDAAFAKSEERKANEKARMAKLRERVVA